MSEQLFTPGPWHMGQGNGVGRIFGPEGCGRSRLASAGTTLYPICSISEMNGHEVEDLANARLIAACPSLLAALEALAGWHGNPGSLADLDRYREQAIAALALAGK